MLSQTLIWGSVVGLAHFMIIGLLYGNPLVDRVYKEAQDSEPGVRKWPSMPAYMVRQFLGTQVEIYILAGAYLWLRGLVPYEGYTAALVLGALFAGLRVYPRFWNMWIQSTYPNRLLAIELVNGFISTLVVTMALQLLVSLNRAHEKKNPTGPAAPATVPRVAPAG